MRKSPFNTVHEQLGARFENFNGWSLPADFGDADLESKSLKDSCAVVDLCSFGRIQVSGKSTKDAMNPLFDTEKGVPATDRWVWARPVGYDGDTLCRIYKVNGSYTLLTQPAHTESMCQWLESAVGQGGSVVDVTDKTAMLGLYGPRAFESMRGVLPFDIDHMDRGDAEKMSFMMLGFTLLRGSWLNDDGLELICPAAAGPLAAGAVARYRHKHNITPAGMNCLQAAMARMDQPL